VEELDGDWMWDRWEDDDYWQALADHFASEHEIFKRYLLTECE
jgi:hypothetical protein